MTTLERLHEGEVAVLAIPGPRAVQTGVKSFQRLMEPHLAQPCPRIVLDLSEVEFIDSSFLGAMVFSLKQAVAKDGDLKLAAMPRPLRSLFSLLRLQRIFEIHETVESARHTFHATAKHLF